ncbi:MAG: zinc-ribbon domain-containing protein [Candidatus Nitronauta litoralis]|uniref:Zinc-ribbon domain-containing protein n=1 Tax=Candidatus Nitronauta litoralis TaxID=2705533 RepID=A0A7T0BXA1_9BACT|nr:MAG: zinc-ribbon domain-containing protein [Candidatus Nitronauta litoralis]
MFCPSCGSENSDQANFCTKCGNQINPDADPQVPQQYQQPQPPQHYQQPPQYGRPSMKENFTNSAVSGAGTYAGCCCMNALSNLLCDACG